MQMRSRGEMNVYPLFGVKELGFRDPESQLDRVIQAFLSVGEAVAARWIQMPKAIFLFQVAPGISNSGAIYVYDRIEEQFYMLTFEGPEDNLTVDEFGEILCEYKLLDCVRERDFPKSIPKRQMSPNLAMN